MRPLKLGSAGIRGEVGSGLTPENSINFARAFGSFCQGRTVVIARDTRFSSEMIYNSVCSGLLSCGCSVYDFGIAPAGLIHFAIPKLQLAGGLLISGGHQDAGWNSIIPLNNKGAYFNSLQLRELYDIYHSGEFLAANWHDIHDVLPLDLNDSYLDTLCNTLDTNAIRKRRLTVVADFCNGAGSELTEKMARRLNINLIPINHLKSGILPHSPEPRPRNVFQAQSLIKPLRADFGCVFNSDMSRMCLVTDESKNLSEEYTFPIAAAHLLQKLHDKENLAVSNISSSAIIDHVVKAQGGKIIKTKVGKPEVINGMLEAQALLSGEGCGSFTSSEWLAGFDGVYMLAILCEALAVSGQKLSELRNALPTLHICKKTFKCSSSKAYNILRNIRHHFKHAAISEEDGVRVNWRDGWLSLRASHTEQLIRVVCEAKSDSVAEEKVEQVTMLIERLDF